MFIYSYPRTAHYTPPPSKGAVHLPPYDAVQQYILVHTPRPPPVMRSNNSLLRSANKNKRFQRNCSLQLKIGLLRQIHGIYSKNQKAAQQEKIQRTEEKRCTVNHVAEFVKRNSDSQRTKVQRYTEGMRLRCTERCTERSDLRCTVSTPLLEFRFYSSFGVPLLLLFWSSITTPLLELCF